MTEIKEFFQWLFRNLLGYLTWPQRMIYVRRLSRGDFDGR